MYTSSHEGECRYSLWVNGHITVSVYSINQSEETTERRAQTQNSSMISSPIRLQTNHRPTASLLEHTSIDSQCVTHLYIHDNTSRFTYTHDFFSSSAPCCIQRQDAREYKRPGGKPVTSSVLLKESQSLILTENRHSFSTIYFVSVTRRHPVPIKMSSVLERRQVNKKPFREGVLLN